MKMYSTVTQSKTLYYNNYNNRGGVFFVPPFFKTLLVFIFLRLLQTRASNTDQLIYDIKFTFYNK